MQVGFGEDDLTHVLNLVEEGVFDETLVEKEGVVVDNIDEVGAGRSAGSAGERLGLGGVLKRREESVEGSAVAFTRPTYPEGNLLNANTLHDLPLDESFALGGAVDGADVAKDLLGRMSVS